MRGQVEWRERARQIRDYSGLTYGTITPSDIDGLIEYKNKKYVMLELKFGDTPLSHGQAVAFERTSDSLNKDKPCLYIVAKHYHPINEDIDAANAVVVRYRWNGEWYPDKRHTSYIGGTVKKLVDYFLLEWEAE